MVTRGGNARLLAIKSVSRVVQDVDDLFLGTDPQAKTPFQVLQEAVATLEVTTAVQITATRKGSGAYQFIEALPDRIRLTSTSGGRKAWTEIDPLTAQDMGSTGHRTIMFDLWNGNVWVRHQPMGTLQHDAYQKNQRSAGR